MGRTLWKKRLDPLAALVNQVYGYVHAAERTDEELRGMIQAAKKATRTNCGWDTYEAARLVLREAPWELRSRREERRAGS